MIDRQVKNKILKAVKAFNQHPEKVKASIFNKYPFFDPEDKVQVKYEMLRAREVDKILFKDISSQFGFTRESYRHILKQFYHEGVAGLFDHKRGRKGAVKATQELKEFICSERSKNNKLTAEELAKKCYEKYGVIISRRTVFRILKTTKDVGKKKR